MLRRVFRSVFQQEAAVAGGGGGNKVVVAPRRGQSTSSTGNPSSSSTSTSTSAPGTSSGATSAGAKNPYKIKNLSTSEKIIVCTVFSIAGSTAVMVVRPTLKAIVASGAIGDLPADAGFINGPWSYRALYFSVMWPCYTVILFTIGTLFGRRAFFAHFVCKMWGRFLPSKATAQLQRLLGAPQQ